MKFKRTACICNTLLVLFAVSAVRATQPNVVVISAEDLGYGDLSCYGATLVHTPNIDQLALGGRKFIDAHSASAASSPSRYALLTGQYPLRAADGGGLWAPVRNTSALVIDPDQQTIADIFSKKGYATAVVGNWHLGFGQEGHDWSQPLRPGPLDLGFDYYFGVPVINSESPFVYVENDQVVGHNPEDPLVYVGQKHSTKTTPLTPLPPESQIGKRSANAFSGAVEAHQHYNDLEVGTKLTERAIDWIQSQDEQPFFLYYSTIQIHHPYTPAPQFRGTSEAGIYGDFIHELDWVVGEIVQCLKEQGVLENTLIIFTSDNGGSFSQIGQGAYKQGHAMNGELLGFKFGAWEGGHRVPFIAHWPSRVEAGTVSDQLLSSVDLLATFAALTNQPHQSDDSVNMLPALVGDPEAPIRDHLVIAARQESHLSLRKGKWMYIPFKGSGGFKGKKPGQNSFAGPAAVPFVGKENSDIHKGKIKKGAPPAQLYDLYADLSQTTNLYHEYPDVVEQMKQLLSEYQRGSL